MISNRYVKRICCEDFSLIENFEKAINAAEKYECHHRKEDEGFSKQELIDLGLYYGRPAAELIFLTKAEHMSLHHKGKKISEKHKERLSETHLGNKNAEGHTLTEESRSRIRKAFAGKHWYKDKETGKRVWID